jgi:hypothetical protein
MGFIPFVFIDGQTIISYLGEKLTITENDLENYRQNDLTDSDIKAMAYSYLTSIPVSDLNKTHFQSYEF